MQMMRYRCAIGYLALLVLAVELRELADARVVKYAAARKITVYTGVTNGHVLIRVADDGRGFSGAREGRGLASMHRRARALGATLDLTPSVVGTTLSLFLPRAT